MKTIPHDFIEIRAVYDEKRVRVYQAFREEIAREAIRLGTFGPHFALGRMTWIKPSFLWMMYRSGWAQKEGQEHILAIDLRREAFDRLLENAVLSSWFPESGVSQQEWKQQVRQSDIRCQWDPERDPHGHPLPYRSAQLGLRGQVVRHYVTDWILGIEDITDRVKFIKAKADAGEDITPLLPPERVYPMTQTAKEHFQCVRPKGKEA